MEERHLAWAQAVRERQLHREPLQWQEVSLCWEPLVPCGSSTIIPQGHRVVNTAESEEKGLKS